MKASFSSALLPSNPFNSTQCSHNIIPGMAAGSHTLDAAVAARRVLDTSHAPDVEAVEYAEGYVWLDTLPSHYEIWEYC